MTEKDGKDEAPTHVRASRSGAVQLARTGGRRLFREEARREFLEWFAATANVVWSARKAGFCHQTIWKHRMNDEGFAEAFDRALEQGKARVLAKLIESREKAAPIEINGDYEAPELDIDPQVALSLLRDHRGGGGRPGRGLRGRRPRLASNAEVRAALVKRLTAFGIRESARDGGAEEAGADAA